MGMTVKEASARTSDRSPMAPLRGPKCNDEAERRRAGPAESSAEDALDFYRHPRNPRDSAAAQIRTSIGTTMSTTSKRRCRGVGSDLEIGKRGSVTAGFQTSAAPGALIAAIDSNTESV